MITLPPIPQKTTFAGSAWLRDLRQSVESSRPGTTSNFSIQESVGGYTLIPKRVSEPRVRWMGDFDPDFGYEPGDMVHVATAVVYQGTNLAGTVTAYQSFKGTYVCEFTVPLHFTDANLAIYKNTGYLYEYLVYLNTARNAKVVYAPCYPEPTVLPTSVVSPAVQGRYWRLIAFDPTTVNLCSDGVAETFWVGGALSGSI